uniref:Uncharacterized protein n=1 Tax=Arundo donax TaxID=35708 RepID=A0A0A9A4D7_ARUDO
MKVEPATNEWFWWLSCPSNLTCWQFGSNTVIGSFLREL